MKYKVEKIYTKYKTLSDDTDIYSIIRGNSQEIVNIFDDKDLEKKLNVFAKQGWELIHCESKSDFESKIIGTETRTVHDHMQETAKGYKGGNKLPAKHYKQNMYKKEFKPYYLCFFKKS